MAIPCEFQKEIKTKSLCRVVGQSELSIDRDALDLLSA
jgi:hypothetical protein